LKKLGHDRPLVERLFVVLDSFHFHEPDTAVSQGVIVTVTVHFLDKDFVLESGQICGDIVNGGLARVPSVSADAAPLVTNAPCTFATQLSRYVFPGGPLQLD